MATLIFYQRILYSRGWGCVSQHLRNINKPFFNVRRLAPTPVSYLPVRWGEQQIPLVPRPFGQAVWHSCRMGARNQEQTRGRIGPQHQLGNLRVGELLFQIRLHALYSTRPHGLVQAICWHTCPDLDLGP